MRVLVTGGTGFIGTTLVSELLDEGHEVCLLARKGSGQSSGHNHSCQIIWTDDFEWADACQEESFEACIHLAWIATPGIYLNDPSNQLYAEATVKLSRALFQRGLDHFIGLGTCLEYSPNPTHACTEDITATEPVSPYALAKRDAQRGVEEAAKTFGGKYSWVRLFYPYGKHEHPSRTIKTFLRNLSADQRLTLRTPDSVKDFVDVRDVASAIRHLLEAKNGEGIINLGSGEGVSVFHLAELTAAALGKPSTLVEKQMPPAKDLYAYHVADISKILRTGWKPIRSLKDGIEEMKRDYAAAGTP